MTGTAKTTAHTATPALTAHQSEHEITDTTTGAPATVIINAESHTQHHQSTKQPTSLSTLSPSPTPTPDLSTPTNGQPTTTSTTHQTLSFKEACITNPSHFISENPSSQPLTLPFATSHDSVDEHPFIPISEEEYKEICQPWENAIICKVVGKSFSKDFLKKELERQWRTTTRSFTSLGKGFYTVQCGSVEDRTRIIVGGPWNIQGYHVWVQCWEAGFKPSQASISKGPVWCSLPELPLELYKQGILERVGQSLGTLLKIDANSLEGERKRYASLCVLVEKNTTPCTKVWIGKILQEVHYEEGVWYCGRCQKFGHGPKSCPALSTTVEHGVSPITAVADHPPKSASGWIQAKRRNRGKSRNGKQTQKSNIPTFRVSTDSDKSTQTNPIGGKAKEQGSQGTRFAVLEKVGNVESFQEMEMEKHVSDADKVDTESITTEEHHTSFLQKN